MVGTVGTHTRTVSALSVVFAALVAAPAGAKSPTDPASPLALEFQLDHWTTRDGLPQNSVIDILQARDGTVWFATFGGIARFDGVAVTSLASYNTPGLSASRFTSLAETADGTLWFGSEGEGLFRYDGREATQVGPSIAIWDLALDDDGTLWAASTEVVLSVRGDTVEEHPGGTQGLRHLAVADGAVVASGVFHSRHCVGPRCDSLPVPPAGLEPDAERRRAGRWLLGPDDTWWVSSPDQLFRRDGDAWTAFTPPAQGAYRSGLILPWGDQVWVSHEGYVSGDGLGDTMRWTQLSTSGISSVMVDSEGGAWFGTDGGGVYRLQRNPLIELHGLKASVFSVAPAPGGGVWSGGEAGLQPHEGAQDLPDEVYGGKTKDIYTLWPDGRGGVLIPREQTLLRATVDGVREVASLSLESRHEWFKHPPSGPFYTEGATVRFVPEEGPVRTLIDLSADGAESARPVHWVGPEAAWVSVDEERLVLIEGGAVTREIALPSAVQVRTILDRGRRTWIGTYGLGLLAATDDEVVASLVQTVGMCDDKISHLFDVGDGRLWFNTNRGVGWVDEGEVEAFLRGDSQMLGCSLVGSPEGNGNAGFVDDEGHFWVPTVAGLAEILPEQRAAVAPPRVSIEEATYGMADLLAPDTAVPARRDALGVRFTAIHFTDPVGLVFQHRLLGLSDTWSGLTTDRDLRVANLPPGDYTFEVKARGRAGGWSEPVQLAFRRPAAWSERPIARVLLPGGAALVVLSLLGLALRNAARRNRQLHQEIAERQRAEERLREEQEERQRVASQLESARRLESIGRLAGGVAHDFNNLLTVVAAHTTFLGDQDDEEVQLAARDLSDVVIQGKALTEGLLVFGQAAPSLDEGLELGREVEALLPMLTRLIREDIAVVVEVRERCGVRIDRGRLGQIVMNLVGNARDAIRGTGTVRLVVERSEGWSTLSVSDDGRGIAPEVREKIFEPYFTTKGRGHGTGLGLAAVHGAVTEAGGTIHIEGALGEGTTVIVRLPYEEVDEAPAKPSPRAEVDLAGLRVLMVDDRQEVLRAMQRVGARCGWQVQAAHTLEQAVAAARGGPLDLLITDVVMPDASGPEVAAAVSAEQPDVSVLYMSGHTDGVLERHQVGRTLRKPFTRDQLLRAVEDTVGESRSTGTARRA